jgi:hypothetical protein
LDDSFKKIILYLGDIMSDKAKLIEDIKTTIAGVDQTISQSEKFNDEEKNKLQAELAKVLYFVDQLD